VVYGYAISSIEEVRTADNATVRGDAFHFFISFYFISVYDSFLKLSFSHAKSQKNDLPSTLRPPRSDQRK